MYDIAPKVVAIAEASLGGLQGKSALLIGPQQQRYPYLNVLRNISMKYILEEDVPNRLEHLISYVQLIISVPAHMSDNNSHPFLLSAASIAQGCAGRRTPLVIFDLSPTPYAPSVEEMAGLLPAVCLYTPDDISHILAQEKCQNSIV